MVISGTISAATPATLKARRWGTVAAGTRVSFIPFAAEKVDAILNQ